MGGWTAEAPAARTGGQARRGVGQGGRASAREAGTICLLFGLHALDFSHLVAFSSVPAFLDLIFRYAIPNGDRIKILLINLLRFFSRALFLCSDLCYNREVRTIYFKAEGHQMMHVVIQWREQRVQNRFCDVFANCIAKLSMSIHQAGPAHIRPRQLISFLASMSWTFRSSSQFFEALLGLLYSCYI